MIDLRSVTLAVTFGLFSFGCASALPAPEAHKSTESHLIGVEPKDPPAQTPAEPNDSQPDSDNTASTSPSNDGSSTDPSQGTDSQPVQMADNSSSTPGNDGDPSSSPGTDQTQPDQQSDQQPNQQPNQQCQFQSCTYQGNLLYMCNPDGGLTQISTLRKRDCSSIY
jgi:hypothetical protein